MYYFLYEKWRSHYSSVVEAALKVFLNTDDADNADLRRFVIAGLTRNLFAAKGIPCLLNLIQ